MLGPIRTALLRGKVLGDAEVANKLHARACGYSHQGTKVYRNDDGSVIQVPYTVEHPPDTQAASLWLRNRQPALMGGCRPRKLRTIYG